MIKCIYGKPKQITLSEFFLIPTTYTMNVSAKQCSTKKAVLTPGSGFGYFVPHESYKMWARENGDILKISQDKPSLLGEHKCLDSQRVIITSESEF